MKKSILSIGKALDKLEQKQINGGNNCWPSNYPGCNAGPNYPCSVQSDCPSLNYVCESGECIYLRPE